MNVPESAALPLAEMNERLPAFAFEAVLAASDHGCVYLARQRSLDRQVAFKLLSREASSNPTFCEAFQTHAKAMASLNHPNLISVFDSGLIDGMLFCVSEFVPGKSLARSMAGKPIEWELSLQLLQSIANGLAHAHRNDIVHGLLSADDILLTPKAEPKIGNFGLSGPGKIHRHPLPTTVAPEVAAGGKPDPRSDVFSLGALFYQLVTGQPHGPDQPPPSSLMPCPTEADSFWQKATHPKAGMRFQSVAELQSALQSLQKPQPQAAAVTNTSTAASGRARVAAAAPPANSGAPPSTPPSSVKVGFNWTLLRNLLIIAALLVAIRIAWQRYQQYQAINAERQRQVDADYEEKKRQALDAARARSDQGNSAQPDDASGSDANAPAASPKVREGGSLEALRQTLAEGKRSVFPNGTVARGSSHYLLVNSPMSWPAAAAFAELHGGHLAIPSAEANLQWIRSQFPPKPGLWLGAGRSGGAEWTLADATRWNPTKPPVGRGTYLAVDAAGTLIAANATSKLPFVIQWRNDGSNPGSLSHWLKVTQSTLRSANPVFPPGTWQEQQRRYLLVLRPCTWDEARALAAAGGGQLASPASAAEHNAINAQLTGLTANDVLWLGAVNSQQRWSWLSGKTWGFTSWAPQADVQSSDSALVLRPGTGWEARKAPRQAKGFIIEWSR